MQKHILIPIVGAVALVALLLGGWYMGQSDAVPAELIYVLEPVEKGIYTGALPDLEYVPTVAGLTEAQESTLAEKIREITKQLKRYPYDGNAWMELAIHYRVAGDYRAAERVWLFIVDTTPNNVTALGNLGRQYHFELKQFEKAEEYFKKALEANPDRKEAYFDLLDLYRYSYKTETTAAVDIMKEGIARFPDDVNFLTALGSYYRDTGRPNQARAQFEKALTMARTAGDMNLIQNLTTELSRL